MLCVVRLGAAGCAHLSRIGRLADSLRLCGHELIVPTRIAWKYAPCSGWLAFTVSFRMPVPSGSDASRYLHAPASAPNAQMRPAREATQAQAACSVASRARP